MENWNTLEHPPEVDRRVMVIDESGEEWEATVRGVCIGNYTGICFEDHGTGTTHIDIKEWRYIDE